MADPQLQSAGAALSLHSQPQPAQNAAWRELTPVSASWRNSASWREAKSFEETPVDIKTIAFDTGGTVLDWHGGLVRALARVGARHGLAIDGHAAANDWRRRTMQGIVGQVRPDFHMDDVHRRVLDETLLHYGLQACTDAERTELWRTWWPASSDCSGRRSR